MSPLCESYVPLEQLGAMEAFYPLHVRVCEQCLLVQLEELVAPEAIFTEYAYFSSYSGFLGRPRARLRDLRRRALRARGGTARWSSWPATTATCSSTSSSAAYPRWESSPRPTSRRRPGNRGIETVVEFFGRSLASRLVAEGREADLLIANNVLAARPRPERLRRRHAELLSPDGVITIEVPHLVRLIDENQFDTIYHEHFSYFSFLTARTVLAAHGLEVFDVEELATHGGSLRVYARQRPARRPAGAPPSPSWPSASGRAGSTRLAPTAFAERVAETKWRLLEFLIECRREGKRVAGYGAPGKGNTLLNYCGIRTDLLEFTVDRNPYKQGQFPPGHPHPDPPSRGARAGPSGLHPDPSLEPARTRSWSSWPTRANGADASSSRSRR